MQFAGALGGLHCCVCACTAALVPAQLHSTRHPYSLAASSHTLISSRSVFERAVAYCASDPKATPLWERYLAFEGQTGGPARVAALFARALQCPLDGLDRIEAG